MRQILMACLVSVLVAGGAAQAQDAGKPSYVVVVDYAADAQAFDALKALVFAVARASLAEPGCRRFDVVQPSGTPNRLTLYEIFDDAAAFQIHAAAAHFKQFAAETAKLGATRTATPGTLLLSLAKP